MKRYAAIATIVVYLGALGWGVVSHTLSLGHVSHPAMYYLVWDMFCGWSGYESRHHLIAQGVSGEHYLLNPAPWGEFKPYGPAYRTDYDSFGMHSIRIAQSVLNHTDHEPIQQIFLVEESWSKRYNRPDFLWRMEFEEEKDQMSYFHTRATYNGDGMLVDRRNNWTTAMAHHHVASDPRLVKLRSHSRPFFAVSPNAGRNSAPNGMPNAAPISNASSPIQQTWFPEPATP